MRIKQPGIREQYLIYLFYLVVEDTFLYLFYFHPWDAYKVDKSCEGPDWTHKIGAGFPNSEG